MVEKKLTFGRRTWDREEYAELARKRKEGELLKPTTKKQKSTSFPLDFTKDLNKRTIITTNITQTRGKAFGFYCELCDLTYKDNLKYIDHLNSKVHFFKLQEQGNDTKESEKIITLDDVKKRYDMLCKKLDEIKERENDDCLFDIKKHMKAKEIKQRILKEESIRKREDKEEKMKIKKKQDLLENGLDEDVIEVLGITGFGSTKK